MVYSFWSILLHILAVGAASIFYFFYRRLTYWSMLGVPGPQPLTPFGNVISFILKGRTKLEKQYLKQYGKIYGMYRALKPVLTINDSQLIKQIMVKDFPNFINRETIVFKHEIFEKNIYRSEDENWKRIRSITSPTFTTKKLRAMHKMMNLCIDKLQTYFENAVQTSNGEINIKKVMTGFTIDVIASTSFAVDSNANNDKSGKNAFLENGVQLFQFDSLKVLAFFLLPKLIKNQIGATVAFSEKPFNFFINLTKEIIKQRRNEKTTITKRDDLVQLMMDSFVYEKELNDEDYHKLTANVDHEEDVEELDEFDPPHDDILEIKKENNKPTNDPSDDFLKRHLTENEIIAQCILFFIAGFETTASSLSNVLYELALHPNVQKRLKTELDQELDGIDTNSIKFYDKVTSNQIPYLDAVIKETMRLFPPVARIQRRCNKDGYTLGGVVLEKDSIVEVSPYAVHHNEEYYPEPERFNPERFMPENKHLLVPYTYLPFGIGPRNCIGMRFAYQEMKLCLARIVRNFEFSKSIKTQVPLKVDNLFVLSSKNIHIKVGKRSNE